MMRSTDLVPLFDRPAPGLTLEIGSVGSWNTSTGANSIGIGDAGYSNLPVAGPLTGIAPGDQVVILSTGTTKYVIGKLTRP